MSSAYIFRPTLKYMFLFAWSLWQLYSKPIFYCNLKPLELSLYSTRTQNTWRRGVALGSAPDARILRYPTQNIPTCWYLWRWVTQIFCVLPDAKPKICVTPNANPRRQPVEYRWHWVFWSWPCIFHVEFMKISCCLCTFFRVGNAKISRCKGRFQWNTGSRLYHCRYQHVGIQKALQTKCDPTSGSQ